MPELSRPPTPREILKMDRDDNSGPKNLKGTDAKYDPKGMKWYEFVGGGKTAIRIYDVRDQHPRDLTWRTEPEKTISIYEHMKWALRFFYWFEDKGPHPGDI